MQDVFDGALLRRAEAVLEWLSGQYVPAFAVPGGGGFAGSRPFELAVSPDNGEDTPDSSGSSGSSLLKDKVNSLLRMAEEDEEDEALLEELSKPKKKFFGLFGK